MRWAIRRMCGRTVIAGSSGRTDADPLPSSGDLVLAEDVLNPLQRLHRGLLDRLLVSDDFMESDVERMLGADLRPGGIERKIVWLGRVLEALLDIGRHMGITFGVAPPDRKSGV